MLEQGDKITTQCTKCGKKMKVVKKPSCSCYGGFDCEVCNPDYYEEMTTTDTPHSARTRMETAHLLCDSDDFEDVISTLKKEGAELERELDEARAEVEKLRGAILQAVNAFDKIPWCYDGDCGSGDIFSFLADTLN